MNNSLSLAPFSIDLVMLSDTMVSVIFHPRNVKAASAVRRMGSPHSVMNMLARQASALHNIAKAGGPATGVIQQGNVAVVLCLEEAEETLAPVLQVGVYAVPAKLRVNLAEEGLKRMRTWVTSDPQHIKLIQEAAISLWISVPDPSRDLRLGRTATVAKLDDGDYICVQFTGLSSGKHPFLLYIEGGAEAERLIKEEADAKLPGNTSVEAA